MNKERSFSSYICSQYQAEISSAIETFAFDNSDNFNLRVVEEVTEVECGSIYPKKAWIRNMPELQLEFDLAVEAELNFCEHSYRREEEEPITQWFLIKGIVDFDNPKDGLIVFDVQEYEPKYQADTDYTDSLSPCIYDKNTESKASQFIHEYFPEMYKRECELDVGTVVDRMGLTVKQRHLSSDLHIFGQIFFKDSQTETYPDDSGTPVMEKFKANTILIDDRVFFLRNYGSIRHTIVHECLHWYLHRKTFLLAQCMKQAESGFKCCITGEQQSHKQSNDAWFLEWQANKIASKVLVPEPILNKKVADYLSDAKTFNPRTSEVYLMKEVVERIAEFFNVSIQVAKIRMSECGYNIVEGAFDYCDGRYLKPYAFKRDSLGENETYSVGCEDLIIESMKSSELAGLINECRLVYADSHLVVNVPKYIQSTENGRELTEYARLHLDECGIKFSVNTKTGRNGANSYRECILCRGFSGHLKAECTFDATSNKDNISMAKAIKQQQRSVNKLIDCIKKTSFSNSLVSLMTAQKITVEKLAKLSGISDKQITRLRTGETEQPFLETVVALGIGLDLPYDVSMMLLDTVGYSLQLSKNEHMLYRHFLSDGCIMTIHECNQMLEDNGYKTLC